MKTNMEVLGRLRPHFLKLLFQVIADFISYLEEWGGEKENARLSTQTHRALLISLKAVLDLVVFLQTQGFEYLMTKHVNQDPLEVKANLTKVNSDTFLYMRVN